MLERCDRGAYCHVRRYRGNGGWGRSERAGPGTTPHRDEAKRRRIETEQECERETYAHLHDEDVDVVPNDDVRLDRYPHRSQADRCQYRGDITARCAIRRRICHDDVVRWRRGGWWHYSFHSGYHSMLGRIGRPRRHLVSSRMVWYVSVLGR